MTHNDLATIYAGIKPARSLNWGQSKNFVESFYFGLKLLRHKVFTLTLRDPHEISDSGVPRLARHR